MGAAVSMLVAASFYTASATFGPGGWVWLLRRSRALANSATIHSPPVEATVENADS
jgi:hypothetical protein